MYKQVAFFGLLAASAGCDRSTPSTAPTPAIDSTDFATQDQNRVATGMESIAPPENTLGVLLQPIPKLPEEGSVYSVGEFPLHSIPLLPGPEDDLHLVQTHCSVCHSTSYISAQPPLSRAAWEAEVKRCARPTAQSFPILWRFASPLIFSPTTGPMPHVLTPQRSARRRPRPKRVRQVVLLIAKSAPPVTWPMAEASPEWCRH